VVVACGGQAQLRLASSSAARGTRQVDSAGGCATLPRLHTIIGRLVLTCGRLHGVCARHVALLGLGGVCVAERDRDLGPGMRSWSAPRRAAAPRSRTLAAVR
jgi:hypothetical protein